MKTPIYRGFLFYIRVNERRERDKARSGNS